MLQIFNNENINELIKNNLKIKILDFGCGCCHLYQYIKNNIPNYKDFIEYNGLDISLKFCQFSKQKFPDINIFNLDVINDESKFTSLPQFDYIILNGVFTEKRNLSFNQMENFLHTILNKIKTKANKGIVFNLMTPFVDWKDDKLFYYSYDKMGTFLKQNISKNFIFDQSYNLWEYSIYIYL